MDKTSVGFNKTKTSTETKEIQKMQAPKTYLMQFPGVFKIKLTPHNRPNAFANRSGLY